MRTGNATAKLSNGKASLACAVLRWRLLLCGVLLGGTHATADEANDFPIPTNPSALVAPTPAIALSDTAGQGGTPVLTSQTSLVTKGESAQRPGVQSIRDISFSQPREAKQSGYTSMRVPTTYRTKSWVAPRAVHRTLFFQDNPLERHGKTNHPKLQPAVSVARFFADAILYPARQLADVGHPVHYATSPR